MNEEYNVLPPETEEEQELSHSDKLIGLVSEPGTMFAKASRFPIRTIDWLLPLLAVLVVTIISSIAIVSVPEIKMEVKEKAKEQMNKRLDEALKKGASAETVAQQREMGEKQIDYIGTPTAYVIQAVSILIIGFIVFLVIAGYFFVLFKFGLKNPVTYVQSLFIYGMVQYIGIINIIVNTLIALLTKKSVTGISANLLVNADPSSFQYLVLSKIDPFAIVVYILIAIGFSKFAKAEKPTVHLIGVIGSWLGFSLLWFLLTTLVPFFAVFKG